MSDGYATIWRTEVLDIHARAGAQALAVYLYLSTRANIEGIAWPSLEKMAEEFGVSVDTVRRAVHKLQLGGFLEIIPVSGQPSKYQLTPSKSARGTPSKSATHPSQNCKDTPSKSATKPLAKLPPKEYPEKNTQELLRARFAQFWSAYPKRNGRKVGKQAALELFSKLPEADRQQAIQAAKNYAASDQTFHKDAERFLKKDFWRDWLEDAEPEATPTSARQAAIARREQMLQAQQQRTAQCPRS